ncbi:hypothetical protein K402DRAFT_447286 [Aulographum hederae CBS 113979]|uniref:Sister chromatid cohesion protein n=1 Tax=Aulographum hederae CBS 113979 TaxID=1176131 RepID=A0A6G1GVQ6_9PEZI|nr:hypothetical protein K402DRAFT_447286 [Aulographum hederae CBS 113979]
MDSTNGAGATGAWRTPTVDEALQYSPFSSIVPFTPITIPLPSARPTIHTSPFGDEDERNRSGAALESLEQELNHYPQTTSGRLERTLQDLQQLLKADDLPQFQFKSIPPTSPASQPFPNGLNGAHAQSPQISKFAAMVAKRTNISYRYLTPEASPPQDQKPFTSTPPVPHQNASAQKILPKILVTPNTATEAQRKPAGSKLGAALLSPLEYNTTPSKLAVVIPLPPSSQHAEYEALPEVDARIQAGEESPSKKRKREDDDEALNVSYDQRQKMNAAVQNLQMLMAEIFEAEDMGALENPSNYFIPSFGEDQNSPVLAPAIHDRLSSTLSKAISFGGISHISAVDLSRVQRLCEVAATTVENLSLSVGEDWAESDVEEWCRRVEGSIHGLQADRILLRIMTAGREEKELYSEDVVQGVLSGAKHVLDTCIIPITETRTSEASDSFAMFAKHKKTLTTLLQTSVKVVRLLGDLLANVEVSESSIAAMEFLAIRLIFVENAPIEKDSVLGIQKFETLRRVAMDVLARIFARYSHLRPEIINDILSSLEKLPVTRQSARQYKMIDGKPIQLVSALLMRLVQTSATTSHKRNEHNSSRLGAIADSDQSGDEMESTSGSGQPSPRTTSKAIDLERIDDFEFHDAVAELSNIAKPLFDSANTNARHVTTYLIKRALTSTKTGDQPYRNLLDIFTEDFLAVLGSADWPASELILRALLIDMVNMIKSESSTVAAKNMALDIMGLMGSGMSDLRLQASSSLRGVDRSQSELASRLSVMGEELLDDRADELDLLRFDGPYRVAIEYLQARDLDDPQLQSACGFNLAQWAVSLLAHLDSKDIQGDEPGLPKKLLIQIRNMIADPKWLEKEYGFEPVTTQLGRLSSSMTALSLPFNRAFNVLIHHLFQFTSSDHVTLKSRSLKSLVQLLEKDPAILDRSNFVVDVLRCVQDSSPLVRDSALSLLAKCLSFRPTLDEKVYGRVVERTMDAALGVRKRAMKLLKEIYLRNHNQQTKAAISHALLHRIKDNDESVADLARQIFEDIWITPHYHSTSKDDSTASKIALRHQAILIIRTVQRGEGVLAVLDTLLQDLLSKESKSASSNFKVCKYMVAIMFDAIVDNDDDPEKPSRHHILETLTVFAKANPKLFAGAQLEILEPYIKNLSNTDDLAIYRSVIIIFRHVLSSLSQHQMKFLSDVQASLLGSLSRLGKAELFEVVTCLWTLNRILDNTEKLFRVTLSVLGHIEKFKDMDLHANGKLASQVKRYMYLAATFGKVCNFEDRLSGFKEKFPTFKGTSSAALLVDIIYPYTRQKLPHELRESALECIGMICQSWPIQFLRADVGTAFELVFHNGDTKLEQIVLSSFRNFFAQEEKRSESGAEIKVGEGAVYGSERLASSFVATDNDGASTGIAQRFLQHIIRLAIAPPTELALIATQVIASINRQGLVHPKESGSALIALETSSNQTIASIAFEEHRNLHHKHESMFEKEYMNAVQQAYSYQKDILGDPRGAVTQPFAPKLRPLFEVLKTGQSKVRKRFLANLCSKTDFELTKLNTKGTMPDHVLFTRFVVENLAFFDYARLDELINLIACMEKIVTSTGTTVAHAIELDLLKVHLDVAPTASEPKPEDQAAAVVPDVPMTDAPLADEERLRQLTVASMILSMIWETRTYLRRLWGLQKQKDGKSKPTIKDLNKAPTKLAFVTGDKIIDKIAEMMTALDSPEAMMAMCKSFAELLTVDNEVKVAEGDDDDAELAAKAEGYETPSEGEDDANSVGNGPASGGSKGKKRKGGALSSGTPKKTKKNGAGKAKSGGRRKSRAGSSGSPDGDGGWD